MPKISIIIPIYNVESYLPRCLDSILAQTFTDFEIILVNDGSTDKCSDICKEYAHKDKRVVVIQKENGGQSSARNVALDIAKGEYIGFVDSDDYVDLDMYDFLYNNIIEYNSDISICSFYRVALNGHIHKQNISGIRKHMKKEEAIKTLLSRRYFENYLWDKLYKRSLFEGIRFPENQIFEDIAVMYKLFDKCKSVIYVSESKYYYVQRQGSSMNSGFDFRKLKFVKECKKIVEFSESKGGIYNDEARSCYILSNLWCIYEVIADSGNKYKDVLNMLSQNIIRYYGSSLKSQYIRKSDKLSILLLKHGFSVYMIGKIHETAKKLKNTYQLLKFKAQGRVNKFGERKSDNKKLWTTS